MNNVLLALVVGLLAGIGGAFAVHMITTDPSPAEPVGGSVDLSGIDARLAKIEAALGREDALTLRGSADGGGPMSSEDREAIAMSVARQLETQMKGTVKEGVREAWSDMNTAGAIEMGARELPGAARVGRKKASIREAAAELGLSSTEENEVRRAYEDSIEKAIDLLAGEDGDREEVRRDFERLQSDPAARMAMFGKYMPKVMPKIGEFVALEMDRRSRIEKAIGADKARRLQNDFDLEEAGPLSGNLRFETRGEIAPR